MKKALHRLLLSLSIYHFTFFISTAQWVSIPDTNFGTWLNTNGYSACMQGNNTLGWQMDTTCPAVVFATNIDCSNSGISSLSGIQYFASLQYLNCRENYIAALPTLSSALTYLDCARNWIQSLPALPSSLTELGCGDNHLTSLPPLPVGLTNLDCPGNQITALPVLPAGVSWLLCHNNQLDQLPDFPDSLAFCYIQNNPIACLPNINRIVNFIFTNTSLTCLPNYGNVTSSNPPINTMPLCDSIIPNPCAVITHLDKEPSFNFSLSPNPASTSLTITVDETYLNSTATLTDLMGRAVPFSFGENARRADEVAVQLITNHQSLITTAFASSIYLLTLTTPDGRSATKKLVISK